MLKLLARLHLLAPLAYACIVGTVFHTWVDTHPVLAYGIFAALLAIPVIKLFVFVIRIVKSIVQNIMYAIF